jgi:2-iminobutanoate/2-iminopropanoate deaminase
MKILALILLAICGTNAYAQSPQRSIKPFRDSVSSNGLVFVSGQLGVNMITSGSDSFAAEAHGAISNVETILKKSHLSLADVVSVTVYLRNIEQFGAFNQVYLQHFKSPFPARTCVVVKDLLQNSSIEISVVAAIKQHESPN